MFGKSPSPARLDEKKKSRTRPNITKNPSLALNVRRTDLESFWSDARLAVSVGPVSGIFGLLYICVSLSL